ncbi:unnamed protein product [Sympodiomycopsis kandeliae]
MQSWLLSIFTSLYHLSLHLIYHEHCTDVCGSGSLTSVFEQALRNQVLLTSHCDQPHNTRQGMRKVFLLVHETRKQNKKRNTNNHHQENSENTRNKNPPPSGR